MAMWLQNGSVCHGILARPISVKKLLTRPWLSPNRLLKISATATGAMTYGRRTLMRQKVLPRMLRSSIAAMNTARISCGMVESRKMLKVLRSAVQNFGSLRIHVYCSNPTNVPEFRTRSHSWNEITAVKTIGKIPMIANRMKNGAM
jgi:hypothetical protein